MIEDPIANEIRQLRRAYFARNPRISHSLASPVDLITDAK